MKAQVSTTLSLLCECGHGLIRRDEPGRAGTQAWLECHNKDCDQKGKRFTLPAFGIDLIPEKSVTEQTPDSNN